MKKNLFYILISLTLVLAITPVMVNAYDTTTKGKCTVRAYPVGVEETDWLDYTEAQCHADTYPDKRDANAEFIKWTAYSGDCVKPLSRSSVDGSCVCQLPWGVIKDGKCVDPASITCTSTNPNVPTGCTPATQNPPATSSTNYTFLSPLPCDVNANPKIPGCVGGELATFDPTGENKLGDYLNVMIKIFIGICAVLAVIMIVVGGIEYMTSELPESKGNGKNRIMGAIFGLILALGAWTLLYTINPDLLRTDLASLKNVEVTVEIEEDIIEATSTNPACVEADMESITLFGKSGVRVNKKVIGTLRNIESVWLSKGGNNFYQINSISGYNCRAVKNKPNYWSAHAFGLALDINPSKNPYGKTLVTDMLTPNDFTQVFKSAGWGWGGDWKSIKDAMHFSSNNQ
ncbi:M15 family metallopeptidase [Candidatus Nomurabacteria bacterium]|nr:M15 family metallopeptidase [Candidatus Nomurabacteria bacterium]